MNGKLVFCISFWCRRSNETGKEYLRIGYSKHHYFRPFNGWHFIQTTNNKFGKRYSILTLYFVRWKFIQNILQRHFLFQKNYVQLRLTFAILVTSIQNSRFCLVSKLWTDIDFESGLTINVLTFFAGAWFTRSTSINRHSARVASFYKP